MHRDFAWRILARCKNRSVLHLLEKRKNNRGGVPAPLAGAGKEVGVLASTDKPQIMNAHHPCFLRYHIGYFEKLPATSLPVVKNNRSVLHLLEKT
jgi:hypothetical protein